MGITGSELGRPAALATCISHFEHAASYPSLADAGKLYPNPCRPGAPCRDKRKPLTKRTPVGEYASTSWHERGTAPPARSGQSADTATIRGVAIYTNRAVGDHASLHVASVPPLLVVNAPFPCLISLSFRCSTRNEVLLHRFRRCGHGRHCSCPDEHRHPCKLKR